ncbi:MAG: DUF3291 domain-containing protein [Nitratireductor sp.]|nr:DUF3291 domain-containing protein [Nitratireductor sp.]
MHLAELNISKWKINPDTDPVARGFLDNIERINGLAERSDGFIWRLKDEKRDERGRTPIGGPLVLVTLSVWEDAHKLEHFVWNTVHKRIYQQKHKWFELMDSHHFAMWWVEEGHRPTLEEAKQRLDHLDEHGDSDFAFGWSHLPHVKLWQQQRCA